MLFSGFRDGLGGIEAVPSNDDATFTPFLDPGIGGSLCQFESVTANFGDQAGAGFEREFFTKGLGDDHPAGLVNGKGLVHGGNNAMENAGFRHGAVAIHCSGSKVSMGPGSIFAGSITTCFTLRRFQV